MLLAEQKESAKYKKSQMQYFRTRAAAMQAERLLKIEEIAWKVKSSCFDVIYHRSCLQTMQEHVHYFEALISLAEMRFDMDSISELSMVSAGTCYATFHCNMYLAEEELNRAESRLQQLMYFSDNVDISDIELELYQIHPDKPADERFEPIKHQAVDDAYLAKAKANVIYISKSKLFKTKRQRARIKNAEIDEKILTNEIEYHKFSDEQHIETLRPLLNEYFVLLSFSNENKLVESNLILEEIELEFSLGRITDLTDALTKLNNALSAKLKHLEYIRLYNQTALELEYYTQ